MLDVKFLDVIMDKCSEVSKSWHRLGNKNFWFSSALPLIIDGRLYIITLCKSYDTIVAIDLVYADSNNVLKKELYELGKWSRTTSKQVTQYFNTLHDYDRFLLND